MEDTTAASPLTAPPPPPSPASLAGPWTERLARLVVFGVFFALLGMMSAQLRDVMISLEGGFLLAFVLQPAVDRLARRMPRGAAVAATFAIATVVLLALALLVVPLFAVELRDVAQRAPGYVDRLKTEILPGLLTSLGLEAAIDPGHLSEAIEQVGRPLAAEAKQLLGSVGKVVAGTFTVLGRAVTIPVFAIFFAYHFPSVRRTLSAAVPPRHRERATRLGAEAEQTVASFVRGQLTVCFILGTIYGVGLTMSGLKGGLVIGLVAGLLNFVPFLGPTSGILMAVTMAALDQASVATFGGIAATFAISQFLEGWFITPRVVGESVGLNGFAVLVALMVGGELAGLVGVLLAVPAAAVLAILLREVRGAYEASDYYLREA